MRKNTIMRSTEKFNKMSMVKAKLLGMPRNKFLDDLADNWEKELSLNCKIDQKLKNKYAKYPKL